MQVDFYHLTRDPADKLVPMLASKSLDVGKRLLLLAPDEDRCATLSDALWSADPVSFLAHDLAGSEQEADQPILISDRCEAANGASYIVLSDGLWRDGALDFERAFFLFTPDQIDHARTVWRDMTARADVTPRYWKQDGGRWVEGP
ncbi:DNA polymerase III subunit chi [Sphingorhabdus sp. SMR4y]|uniref:DNA polymerase III subunit chi n=1 Tax=Sphingorhabdus sp. SMR4y TaxID=2584094 RepID=UPI000B5C883B|nr:DNA polymerase III subunit chi [Sphingorhabdus sp. SMR4y]ASK88103.1 DNA polymerase III subunit chi [Sphingorhabdus sp. SMR4y]